MKASEQREDRSQREIWNDLVGAAWVRHAAIHDQQAEVFGHAAMDALGNLTGARVLDVGCGTGATAAQLFQRGAAEVLGVDLSEPMIRRRPRLIQRPAGVLRSQRRPRS